MQLYLKKEKNKQTAMSELQRLFSRVPRTCTFDFKISWSHANPFVWFIFNYDIAQQQFAFDYYSIRFLHIWNIQIPGRTVGFPWTQADPAELSFTVLVPTNHVVAPTIFFNGDVAFWTLLLEGREMTSISLGKNILM